MDCRTFRKNHLGFVDDTLSGVEVGRMRDHLEACAACANWDHRVRRSLLVARNQLVSIQPSPGFSDRLTARLAAERMARATPHLMGASPFRWSGLAAMALALAVVGVAATALSGNGARSAGLAHAPAVTIPARVAAPSVPLPSATPAFVATMSTGMAILPALMLAEEVPIRQVSLEDPGVGTRTAGLALPSAEPR